MLEQGFQRAGDDEKLLAFGPIVLELMQGAADLAETHRLPALNARRRLPARTGRRRSSSVEELPSPDAGAGRGPGAGGRRGVNFPDVLLVAGEYQMQLPPPVRARAASSPAW